MDDGRTVRHRPPNVDGGLIRHWEEPAACWREGWDGVPNALPLYGILKMMSPFFRIDFGGIMGTFDLAEALVSANGNINFGNILGVCNIYLNPIIGR